MTFIDSLKRNSIFLSLWLATIVALTIAMCVTDKASLHLALCDHHSAWADTVMPVLSDLANWLPYVIAIGLLIGRWRYGLFVTASLLLSTGLAQAIKHIVRAPRPFTWFAEHHPDISLPLTQGVRMNYWLSFPSGHTTTFFCLFFALCAVYTYHISTSSMPLADNGNTGKKISPDINRKIYSVANIAVQLLLFIAAAVCSYSRIYLNQHFAADVLGGMIVGVLSVAIVWAVFAAIQLFVRRRAASSRC